MASSVSILVDNLGEGIHEIKCMMITNAKYVELNTKIAGTASNT